MAMEGWPPTRDSINRLLYAHTKYYGVIPRTLWQGLRVDISEILMTNMNSFLSFVDRQPEQPPLPEYVWIVEGDAFFTGNVRDFVQHYKPETADFIGKYQSRSLG